MRPYKRSPSGGGRGSSGHPKRKRGGVAPAEEEEERTSASRGVLARAAAIRESAGQFAARECDDSSEDEEEDEVKGREVIKNLLKIYYQDLCSEGERWGCTNIERNKRTLTHTSRCKGHANVQTRARTRE